MPFHVSTERFYELVEQAIEELPPQFAEFLEEVPIEVRDRPTPQQLKHLKMGRNNLLLGLYRGVPLTKRSIEYSGKMPDVIYIFQESIEAVCRNEADLTRQVRTTVLHEIGHHFGLDEDDLEKLGYR